MKSNTIQEARDQVKRLNAQYKADLMSETTEDEVQELDLVLNTSKNLKRKAIHLSLETSDFETIIEVLELEVIKKREDYTFEGEEKLDSGIIRYEYLIQKAKDKSVIITRNSDLNLIVYCIKKQLESVISRANKDSNNIEKIHNFEHLIQKLRGKIKQ